MSIEAMAMAGMDCKECAITFEEWNHHSREQPSLYLQDELSLCSEVVNKGIVDVERIKDKLREWAKAVASEHETVSFLVTNEKCCNRNKSHKKFRALKSIVCVKNHFKRSHCPKLYWCDRCHEKNFSLLSDLKSHRRHCGESKWKCSCGTTFSRKDKLFGHIRLFEGHMPALAVDEEKRKKEEDDGLLPEGFFDDLEEFESTGKYYLQGALAFPDNLTYGGLR